MKKVFVGIAMLCRAFGANAQTWDEWFSQGETQIKYLLEQISALKTYGVSVQKGYAQAKEGLDRIAELKYSDLAQHRKRFASLFTIKEGVVAEQSIRRIVALGKDILAVYTKFQQDLKDDTLFGSGEKVYFTNVFSDVLRECKQAIDESALLMSDWVYQFSDDERLKRLQDLMSNLTRLYSFSRHFEKEITLIALNRMKENTEVGKFRSLY